MESVLEMLFKGEFNPNENLNIDNPQHQELKMAILNEMCMWNLKLSKEDFEKLEEFQNLCDDAKAIELSSAFSYGLKLGIMIMVEVYESQKILQKEIK